MDDQAASPVDIYAEELLLSQLQEKVDKDGYAEGDPYAEAAKKIDNRPAIVKLAEKVIENKDEVGLIERYLKSAFAFIAIVYMVMTTQSEIKGNYSDLLSAFTNRKVIEDFLSREGILLTVAIGGFLLAARYNRYLDSLDLLEARRQTLMDKMETIPEEEEESESEIVSDSRPVYYPLNKALEEYD